MNTFEILITGVGLSMDAFAVSICKGMALDKVKASHYLACGLWFGSFQALMPLLGYLLSSLFAGYIESFDHWIAFGLLALIGAKMIKESFDKSPDEVTKDSLPFTEMLVLALATSIDAAAVGITLRVLNVSILPAVMVIGGVTFLISAAGVRIGAVFGDRFRSSSERVGGAILIVIGVRILLEHLLAAQP